MTVDLGIRLPMFSPDGSELALAAYYERALNSLSEYITTVWLNDYLQKGDSPNLESWLLMAYLAHPSGHQ